MAQHRSSRSPRGVTTNTVTTNARNRWVVPSATLSAAEVTDIIPFNEFGNLDDLDFRENAAFDTEAQVLHAPELDDLDDTDNLIPLSLSVPGKFRSDPAVDVIDAPQPRGLHRKPGLTAGAVKGRLMIAAMATGAAAAGAHTAVTAADDQSNPTVLAASQSAIETTSSGVQLVTVTPTASTAVHNEELANGLAFAQERAEREARLQRPLFVMPTQGIPTSGFGYRWGVLHGGIDIANSIGTPVYAASDGVVIDAGSASGYGNVVKLRHADGAMTLYGHLNTKLVSIGERVMAGDQIATMGNTGNSTGPHLHFEVMLASSDRVNPVPWLAKRGLSIGGLTG